MTDTVTAPGVAYRIDRVVLRGVQAVDPADPSNFRTLVPVFDNVDTWWVMDDCESVTSWPSALAIRGFADELADDPDLPTDEAYVPAMWRAVADLIDECVDGARQEIADRRAPPRPDGRRVPATPHRRPLTEPNEGEHHMHLQATLTTSTVAASLSPDDDTTILTDGGPIVIDEIRRSKGKIEVLGWPAGREHKRRQSYDYKPTDPVDVVTPPMAADLFFGLCVSQASEALCISRPVVGDGVTLTVAFLDPVTGTRLEITCTPLTEPVEAPPVETDEPGAEPKPAVDPGDEQF